MFKRPQRPSTELNTAALPDLIFTILFFFILVTHLREVDVKLSYQLPEGQQLTKTKDKSSLVHVFVDSKGNVQIENSLIAIGQIAEVLNGYKQQLTESSNGLIISFRADRHAKMGIISQVKSEMKKVGTLRINYNATEQAESVP